MPFLANIKYCPEFLEYSLPDTFPEKVIPGINFMDEAVVQCYVPVVKLLFAGAGNLQMITGNHK